jgi:hypothetical protein
MNKNRESAEILELVKVRQIDVRSYTVVLKPLFCPKFVYNYGHRGSWEGMHHISLPRTTNALLRRKPNLQFISFKPKMWRTGKKFLISKFFPSQFSSWTILQS